MSKAENGKRKAGRRKPAGDAPDRPITPSPAAGLPVGAEPAEPAAGLPVGAEPAEPETELEATDWDPSGDPLSDLDRAGQLLAGSVEVEVTVAVPLEPLPPGYVSRHVDVRVSRAQGQVLKRLLAGLVARHARLPKEPHQEHARFAQTNADAVRWLLEEIGQREKDGGDGRDI